MTATKNNKATPVGMALRLRTESLFINAKLHAAGFISVADFKHVNSVRNVADINAEGIAALSCQCLLTEDHFTHHVLSHQLYRRI